jgi:hypothetical protein
VLLVVLFLATLAISSRVGAQIHQFNSGSDGSDGALNITAPGVTYLDPIAMKINPKGDNIFNFTTINIASGSVLKISEVKLHGPVWGQGRRNRQKYTLTPIPRWRTPTCMSGTIRTILA